MPDDETIESLRGEIRGSAEEIRARMDALEGRVSAPPPQTPQQPDKIFTAAEIDAAVEAGNITREQGDGYLKNLERQTLKNEIREEVSAEVNAMSRAKDITRQVEECVDALPALKDEGSVARTRVQAKYDVLVHEFGEPETKATELKALRMTFPDASSLKDRTQEGREVFSDASGGGGADDWLGGAPGAAPPSLSPRLKAHYSEQIRRKLYKGWDDPVQKKELGNVQ